RLGYARYMDDLACFAPAKAALWEARDRIADFLARRRSLELKPAATRLLPVGEGVPWLGLRVWPRHLRLDPPHLRRLAAQLDGLDRRLDRSGATENALAEEAIGILSHAEHARTRAWLRAYFARRAEDRDRSKGREAEDEP